MGGVVLGLVNNNVLTLSQYAVSTADCVTALPVYLARCVAWYSKYCSTYCISDMVALLTLLSASCQSPNVSLSPSLPHRRMVSEGLRQEELLTGMYFSQHCPYTVGFTYYIITVYCVCMYAKCKQ